MEKLIFWSMGTEGFAALLFALTLFESYNMGYTVHPTHPNFLSQTSYNPTMLAENPNLKTGRSNYAKKKAT